jgi:phytoene dehydrogenase-like protein/NAD-dependent dihydropyrimidine dehydrogenase PreA subunit
MQLIESRCTGCGYCVLVCPYDALTNQTGRAEFIAANCTNCNLCVYACPSDCFISEPEFPLRPYRPRINDAYDVVIIGSGLGGLMAGAALAQAGQSVVVFEKLSFPGGRYTELDYKGAAVTTGAWTNLGPKSHIGRFLADLGIALDYISLADLNLTEQYAIRFADGRHYTGLFDMLTPETRRTWLKAVLEGRKRASLTPHAEPAPGEAQSFADSLDRLSAADYITQFSSHPDLLAVVEATVATASGLSSAEMPASEYIQITLDGRAAGRDFAMPKGGVRAIVKALVSTLRQAGGQLFVRTPIAQILVEEVSDASGSLEDGPGVRATGVALTNGRTIRSRTVIHNGGPSRFVQLVGPENLPPDYLVRLAGLKRVECAALFGATRQPLFNAAPILLTPNCRRVVGIFAPTLLDPGLSKTGLHLFDAFFPLHSDNRAAELELALADLHDLFPNFDQVVEWTTPMLFTGSWPGTESGQTFGQTGPHRLNPATPIQNCYLVGMDVTGSGVAGDLIPLGVRRLLAELVSVDPIFSRSRRIPMRLRAA